MQNTPCDFSGKLSHRCLHFAPRGPQLLGHPFLGLCDFPGSFGSRVLQLRRPLVEQFLSRRFLLRVYFAAGLFQRFLILLDLFRRGRLRGFRSLLRANGARVALRHHAQQRLEEKRP